MAGRRTGGPVDDLTGPEFVALVVMLAGALVLTVVVVGMAMQQRGLLAPARPTPEPERDDAAPA